MRDYCGFWVIHIVGVAVVVLGFCMWVFYGRGCSVPCAGWFVGGGDLVGFVG